MNCRRNLSWCSTTASPCIGTNGRTDHWRKAIGLNSSASSPAGKLRWPFRSTARAVGNSGPACSGRSHDCRIFSQVSAVCRWSFSFKAGPLNFKAAPLNFKIALLNFVFGRFGVIPPALDCMFPALPVMVESINFMLPRPNLTGEGQKLMPEKRKFIPLRLSIIPERFAQVALASLPPLFLWL